MDALLTALTMLSDINSIAALLIGIVAGTVIGVIPGLGPSIAIALAIPFTLSMGMGPSIALLMGLYCTSVYGGAITAIILNVPGTPASRSEERRVGKECRRGGTPDHAQQEDRSRRVGRSK